MTDKNQRILMCRVSRSELQEIMSIAREYGITSEDVAKRLITFALDELRRDEYRNDESMPVAERQRRAYEEAVRMMAESEGANVARPSLSD